MDIRICQYRPTLGDIEGNLTQVLAQIENQSHDIICFSELFLVGYPSTDAWYGNNAKERIQDAIDAILKKSQSTSGLIIFGTPLFDGQYWRNAAVAIANGKIIHQHYKCCLPTYDVFNDMRYFSPGSTVKTFKWKQQTIAMLICEDIWANRISYTYDPVLELKNQGVDIVVHLTASPFEVGKLNQRILQLQRTVKETGASIVSINQVGGYGELIFDGQSMAVTKNGSLIYQGPAFKTCEHDLSQKDTSVVSNACPCEWGERFSAITYGIKEYMAVSGFSKALIGVSGGIDSGVVAALAVAALGPENVILVTMPTQYNAADTKSDAIELASRMETKLIHHSIDDLRVRIETDLSNSIGQLSGVTKQNIQARCRGMLLMAISNQTGALLLTTGNKSELAMGYATLYGDMCGGLNPIGDVFKSGVIELAKHINTQYDWIPSSMISRAPSAELTFNQRDDDTLPPYDRLDQILDQYMIKSYTSKRLYELNDKQDVILVLNRLKINEFKRAQSPPILKLSSKSFGQGWQYPVVT